MVTSDNSRKFPKFCQRRFYASPSITALDRGEGRYELTTQEWYKKLTTGAGNVYNEYTQYMFINNLDAVPLPPGAWDRRRGLSLPPCGLLR